MLSVDVVIIGGGLAGTLAAMLLGGTGVRVILIDLHEKYPANFRSEQLVGSQVDTLRRLGVFDILVQDARQAERAVATRGGQVTDVEWAPHYGIGCDVLVNRARRHLPPSVRFMKAQVSDIDLAANTQRVTMSNGDTVECRLVVLATGCGRRLQDKLGIVRKTIRHSHSITFGFNVEAESTTMFESSVLVAYGETPTDGIDYLTLFLMDNRLRANLFTYCDRQSAWTHDFIRQPRETLLQAMPSLEHVIGGIEAVEVRVNHLTIAEGHHLDGIVLIGDAFQTSCPSAGTGIGRLLNDVDRLCNVYVPVWLADSDMSAMKLNWFYKDPVKQACDGEARRVAEYRRSATMGTGTRWKMHRWRVRLQARLRLAATMLLHARAKAAHGNGTIMTGPATARKRMGGMITGGKLAGGVLKRGMAPSHMR